MKRILPLVLIVGCSFFGSSNPKPRPIPVDTTHRQVVIYDTTHVPVSLFDTTRTIVTIYDTTHIPVSVFDSSHVPVVVFDTSHKQVVVVDSIRSSVTVYDTTHKPVTVYDSTRIPVRVYDTTRVPVVVYDTTHRSVTITDTLPIVHVVLPPDTIKPPPVILPPDTVQAAPGTPELPRYMKEMDAMLNAARASDTVTRQVFDQDIVTKALVARKDSLGRFICNNIVQFDSAGKRWEKPQYFPCPQAVLDAVKARSITP